MNSGPQNRTIWAWDGSIRSTTARSWSGHLKVGPRGVFDQSCVRISLSISPVSFGNSLMVKLISTIDVPRFNSPRRASGKHYKLERLAYGRSCGPTPRDCFDLVSWEQFRHVRVEITIDCTTIRLAGTL